MSFVVRAAVLSLVAVVAFSCGGCATLRAAPDLTSDEAESQTIAYLDHSVAGIDKSLIASLEGLSSVTYTCYPPQADPDGSIIARHIRQDIRLTDEAVALDVLNEILAGFDKSEWSIGEIEDFMGEAGSGVVSLSTATGQYDSSYSLRITASPKDTGPATIHVLAMSPCFETK